MADAIWEFDPTAEGTGTALTISTGNYGVTSFSAPAPSPKMQWAGSIDTEGQTLAARGHENRVISLSLEVTGASALATLQDKLAKIHREGGTLKYTSPAGTVNTYDVLIQDGWTPVFDHLHYLGGVTSCSFSLTCKPYGRGAEVDLGDNTETTLPALIFTEATIAGDVPALGRLVIDDDSAVNQWWMTWGIESRYYSSSANAALFYQAEGRTLLGTGVNSSADASASGGNLLLAGGLTQDYRGVLSTQATGGGAHLSHVGSFRVYVRAQQIVGSTGTMTLALEWGEGDFLRYAQNSGVEIPPVRAGSWVLLDLGTVTLTPVTSGTQRWEGRVLAKTTVPGDTLWIDYLMLVPVSEGSGVASGVIRDFTPTTHVGEDHFTSTTAGNALNARVAPTGGTWATSGDATDLAFDDDTVDGLIGEHIKRTVVSGTNGRLAILGSTNYTNVQVQANVFYDSITSGQTLDQGVIARWTDSSNYLRASFERVNSGGTITKTLRITQVLAGSATTLASAVVSAQTSLVWWRVSLSVNTSGTATATITAVGPSLASGVTLGQVVATAQGTSSVLATGGTLATGEPGLWDRVLAAGAVTRYYDDFLVDSLPADAAAFASQSIEVRHDRVRREDSGGTLWVQPSSYLGDYLLVPASGSEARTARVIVKMTRNEPSALDNAIDDISAKLFVTPRYLAPPA